MAGRTQNRMELRRQYEAAEPLDPVEDEVEDIYDEPEDGDEAERRPKKKAKAPARAKAKTPKAAKPAARMRIVWKVVSDTFKTVATFEYSQKEAALAKAAELTAKGKGAHFVQKDKEAMPENAPGLGATFPRNVPAAPVAAAAKPAAPDVEDEEEEEEIEAEDDIDDEDE